MYSSKGSTRDAGLGTCTDSEKLGERFLLTIGVPELAAMAARKSELLATAVEALELLEAPQATVKRFNILHGKRVPSLEEVSRLSSGSGEDQLALVRSELEGLERDVATLVARTTTDGLVLAIMTYANAQASALCLSSVYVYASAAAGPSASA